MEETKIPDFELNKQDVYTIDYIEKTDGKCTAVEYEEKEYNRKYAVIISFEELQKYLPSNDKVLHDTGRYIMDYHKKGVYVSIKDNKLNYLTSVSVSENTPYINFAASFKLKKSHC